MLKLEDIRKDTIVSGLEHDLLVSIINVDFLGDQSLRVCYRKPDGQVHERMVFRIDEEMLSIAQVGRPWGFDASAADFKLAAEAYRIHLAHIFDPMMAVHTSNVEPLPHQITAVYETMLTRQPLRYVLADDPGAGKTIMAGLLIRELLMRAAIQQVLIVAPGSLVEQWQSEMSEKFGLSFQILTPELLDRSHLDIVQHPLCIARLDQLSRNDDLQNKLLSEFWDLVVVDEAHKLSAHYDGNQTKKTKRFELGEKLSAHSRHFLLMTATPHNGKEADFQLFMSLLDKDRFYGKFRDGAHKVDVTDIMRRTVKEDMLKFDGSKLFPERIATTVNYTMSTLESDLYYSVTSYVKDEMNRADRLSAKRKNTVGFALTSLQRRLASSPRAIYQSLLRRHDKLKCRLAEEESAYNNHKESLLDMSDIADIADDLWEANDNLSAERYEEEENRVTDQATAAQSILELKLEIDTLAQLKDQALKVLSSRQDRKWQELSNLLQSKKMRDEQGLQRKLIIFTEYRDTLDYLAEHIKTLLGHPDRVVTIHGGLKREDRQKVQELFRNDAETRVLIATDAAGEGVNLQNAHLMVNYDLPWNPNRLEQRFGRIHRIGQTEVCHLWNIIAANTREGEVFQRLFDKLEIEREALGGRVFDILGEVFENKSLKDLLIEAIRYGQDAKIKEQVVDHVSVALNREHLQNILERNALCQEVIGTERLFAVKEEMEKAEARKLQPFFVQSFFKQAFERLSGQLSGREAGRYEIKYVPPSIRDRHHKQPISRKYERICFEKQYIRIEKPNTAMAALIHPSHPLMQAVLQLTLDEHASKLKQGAIFIQDSDLGNVPQVLVILEHTITEGSDANRVVSRQLKFVYIQADGSVTHAGYAPHLDLRAAEPSELASIRDIRQAAWLNHSLENLALNYAANHLVPEHYQEVRQRRVTQTDKTLSAVRDRLQREIQYQTQHYSQLLEQKNAGKDVALPLENSRKKLLELESRLSIRTEELKRSKNISSAIPVVVGGALVIPAGLLAERQGIPQWSADAAARAHIERIAMQAVTAAEQAKGCIVTDVSAAKCGWDISSQPPATQGTWPTVRHIEVKGRSLGSTTITVTRNEILYALNQKDKFVLAIVLVDGNTYQGPFYIQQPFNQEPDWATASINLDLKELLSKATPAEQSQ